MKRGRWWVGVFLAVSFSWSAFSWSAAWAAEDPVSSASQNTWSGGGAGEIRNVLYDHARPERPPAVHAQVLIDSSASMKGYKNSLPALLHAVDEGLSYSRGVYFTIESKRTCFFDQKRGIFGCQSRVDGVPIPDASGYTNLDKAVSSAGDNELTVILTDGVPSGLSTGKDCVGSGVDAACVSEALSGALRGMPGASPDRRRGVWLVPVITMYQGTYFAEQPIAPNDFDGSAAEAKVHDDLNANARIGNARRGTDGTLLFDYQGPRILLALVIGEVESGRAFLQEFFSHTDFSNIAAISDSKSYKGGTAALPPVEVFPSAIPRQEYSACRQSTDARGRIQGDVINCDVSGANTFHLTCQAKPSSAPLQFSIKEPARPLHLELLAPAYFSFSGRKVKRAVLAGKGSTDRLVLEVSCDSGHRVRCGTDDSRVELISTTSPDAAANELSSSSSVAGQYIQRLSTNRPAMEPHKIYGLADLLENFYRRKLPQTKSSFAVLQFCEE